MILNIDPKIDYAFKHVFGRDATRPILIDVLNKVLKRQPGRLITQVEITNPFNPKEAFDDKLSIVDIKARDQSGWNYNVEMQLLPYDDYEKRILFYCMKIHQQQIHEGEKYGKMNPTISISFLNHRMFPDVPDYHLRFRLLEEKHGFPLTNDMEFHILELPKFTKSLSELTDGLDSWLYFLRHVEKMDIDALPPIFQRQPLIVRAAEELNVLAQNEIERERYESRLKAQMDEVWKREASEQRGHRVGLQEGIQVGLLLGEKRGLIRAFQRMLNLEVSSDEQLNGLSLDELSKLADELQQKAQD